MNVDEDPAAPPEVDPDWYRDLVESAPDGVVLIESEGRILLVNRQTERLFGYAREELIGRQVEILVPEQFRRGHRVHRDGYFAEPNVRDMGAGLELAGRRKDGTEFPIEISLSPIRTRAGMLVTAAIRDATERRRANEKFRALLESAPDAMIIIDDRGLVRLVNAQAKRVFGYQAEALIGKPVEVLIPERLRARHGEHRAGYFHSPKVREMGVGLELWGRRKDGTEFPIEISLSPLRTEDGPWAMAAVRDITERKAVERKLARSAEDLARSNRDLEQFAYVASHDLQAPLRSVIGFSQLLRRKYYDKFDADGREFLDFVENSAKHMQSLINGVLDFARVGSQGADFVEVDAERTLRQVEAQLAAVIEERGAVVTHDPLPRVVASPLEFNQLLQNLIGNALKFRKPGEAPRVHVSAQPTTHGWHFSVRDWGIGISPEHQQRIFQIFQRLHASEHYEGTGIGLAVCQKIVQRHGGRIWVESGAGEGSTFHFTLEHV